ncbi:NlpC/P60 family protein [Aquiluna sp. KACHI24]|uniref:C40 family peptidase n=1 Tax=Aquiluna sp. KACHI24 TaxID=2968831 RepID=UPI0021FD2D54|nr:NlpC/P60 family protein [Aquiluna sp. KACHI24]BDQ00899.1 glycoside hydrolase [Aquiluna sp. KACHI24]
MKRLITIASGLALLVTGVILSPANAVPDYPSAAEVAAAKRNVETKRAMISRIEGILDTLESEARALEKVALQKNEQYNQAKEAANEMAAKVKGLEKKAKTAKAEAQEAELLLGQIVARMYRQGTSGDTTLQIFFNPESSDELLYQLGAQEMIAQRTESVYQAAMEKQAQAKALAVELDSATKELESREAAAKKLYDEAQSAANAVISKVRESERERATAMNQLASLKDTASDLERQRREGLAAEARQNAIKTAPTAPELYTVGDPDSAKVEAAIAFAEAQLGERYVLGGAGPDVWDCSGITMKSYAAASVYIGWHSATAQYNVLASQQKLVPFQQAKRGDLIWWSTERAFSGDKYHVAIYLGNGMMLEAPNPARTVRIVPVRYGELWPYAGRPTAP